MRGWRRSLAVAGTLLALLPAGAAAQSAGDDQYADPFADEQGQETPSAPPAAPAPAPPSQAAPAQVAPAAPAAATAAQAELPRTGADAWLLGLAGLALLSAAAALRVHVRRAP